MMQTNPPVPSLLDQSPHLGWFPILGAIGDVDEDSQSLRIWHTFHHQMCDVRLLPCTDDAQRKLMRKAIRRLHRLEHPNLLPVLDLIVRENQIGLIEPAANGYTLRDSLNEMGALNLDEAMTIIKQLLQGVAALHRIGLIHGAIIPENVEFDVSGGELVVHLRGIGPALLGADHPDPNYQAPEGISGGRPDRRADVFALGVIFYECLAGERPYEGDDPWALRKAIRSGEYTPLQERVNNLPLDVAFAVDSALKGDSGLRFADAGAFARAFMSEEGVLPEAPRAARSPQDAPASRAGSAPSMAPPLAPPTPAFPDAMATPIPAPFASSDSWADPFTDEETVDRETMEVPSPVRLDPDADPAAAAAEQMFRDLPDTEQPMSLEELAAQDAPEDARAPSPSIDWDSDDELSKYVVTEDGTTQAEQEAAQQEALERGEPPVDDRAASERASEALVNVIFNSTPYLKVMAIPAVLFLMLLAAASQQNFSKARELREQQDRAAQEFDMMVGEIAQIGNEAVSAGVEASAVRTLVVDYEQAGSPTDRVTAAEVMSRNLLRMVRSLPPAENVSQQRARRSLELRLNKLAVQVNDYKSTQRESDEINSNSVGGWLEQLIR
ncbi:MAG: protein kinase [Myxococcota bacterium]